MWQTIRRFWKYLAVKLRVRHEERADPKVQLEQAIQEAKEQHKRLTEQAANVIANQKQAQTRLDRAVAESEKASASARQALLLADQEDRMGNADAVARFEEAAEVFAAKLVDLEPQVQVVHARVEARFTAATIEVFVSGRRVAAHARVAGRGRFITEVAHMPHAHRAHAEWTPSRLIAWAEQTGAATGRLVAGILERRPHPEQGYRACLGLMRLGRLHGGDRLDAACQRAEQLRSYRYRTVEHILRHQQDRLPLEAPPTARPLVTHENLRGATYYEECHADPSHD